MLWRDAIFQGARFRAGVMQRKTELEAQIDEIDAKLAPLQQRREVRLPLDFHLWPFEFRV